MWYGKVDGPVEEMRMSLGRKKFIILVGSRDRVITCHMGLQENTSVFRKQKDQEKDKIQC